jgi:DNA-binding NtrC family response regulator
MPQTRKLLIVEDNKAIRNSLELLLPAHFEQVIAIATPNRIPEIMQTHPDLDVVLLDMNFHAGVNTGNEGLYWLKEIKKRRPELSVVLFTAYADIELAVSAIKEGAIDFIEKPWDNAKLIVTLKNAATLTQNYQKIKNLKTLKQESASMFWGSGKTMNQLRRIVEKAAPTDANILILGENGTGKELLAMEIHKYSARSEELMVAVDMNALTETLFESELFGHAKGAFTDAKTERTGKFEIANDSTLFLDEIGNLPLHLQSKILTALQSRHVVRVGENIPRAINIRLICATNVNLEELVKKGQFREDLFYRINTILIKLPPLRERVEDLEPLSLMFLEKYAKKYGRNCDTFSPAALAKLKSYHWPGNIRELQHTIEKAVIMTDSPQIVPEDLWVSKTVNIEKNKTEITIENMEKQMIESELIHCEGNISEAANQLGITRQTLYNKIKKYKL